MDRGHCPNGEEEVVMDTSLVVVDTSLVVVGTSQNSGEAVGCQRIRLYEKEEKEG